MGTLVYYQLYVFLSTLYGGIIIGFMYDIYRIYRAMFKPSKIVTLVQDLLFWIVITIVAIAVLMYSNDGKLRGYTIIGFVTGAIIYNILLSKYVVKLLQKIIDSIKKKLLFLWRIITAPFVLIFKAVRKPCVKVCNAFKPVYLRIKRIFTIPGRVFRDMRKYTKTILSKK